MKRYSGGIIGSLAVIAGFFLLVAVLIWSWFLNLKVVLSYDFATAFTGEMIVRTIGVPVGPIGILCSWFL